MVTRLILLLMATAIGFACKHRTPQPMKTYSILGLGDSYTYGQDVDTSQRYLSQLHSQLIAKNYTVSYPKIIARTGWTTKDLLENIALDKDVKKYDFIFLLIGVNNEYQSQNPSGGYRREFETCLDSAIHRAGNDTSRVFVVSIPDYSVTRSAGRLVVPNEISRRIDEFNKINKEEAERKKVNYIEITVDSRLAYNDKTLIASDGLHPSGKMYAQWVDKILPLIEKKLK